MYERTFISYSFCLLTIVGDVYKDVKKLMHSVVGNTSGQAFKCKPAWRKYAFDLSNIPREKTEYLKVVYPAKYPAPTTSQCSQKFSYIEHIFGATYTPLELFLMKRKLMGPCWIKISRPRPIRDDMMSWCRVEMRIEDPKVVSKSTDNFPIPSLTSICVSMKTAINPVTHTHEVIALSGIVHTKVDMEGETILNQQHVKRFTLIRQLGTSCGVDFPAVFPHDLETTIKKSGNSNALFTHTNERSLLGMFFNKVQQEDPDIFASHNLFGFEFDVLLNRAMACKLPANVWSKIGRLRRTKMPTRGINDRDSTPGRVLCDTYKAAKEFLRETTYR